MDPVFIFALGVGFAALGGELFVRGAVGLAAWARVAPAVVGVTVAAFATSSPELAVGVSAALEGRTQIALGDAMGSNISNVALILGTALLFAPLRAPREAVGRDYPVAAMTPVAIGVMLVDGTLSRLDGVVLLALFAIWLVGVVVQARRPTTAPGQVAPKARIAAPALLATAGLMSLLVAGQLIVEGAKEIAFLLGMDEFLVGATVVAVATSTPELATTLVSRLRGHDDIGLGTILGSNIFNSLFIVGTAAVIAPVAVRPEEAGATILFGLLALAIIWPSRQGLIPRSRGVWLLAVYGAFIATLLRY